MFDLHDVAAPDDALREQKGGQELQGEYHLDHRNERPRGWGWLGMR